MKLFTPEMRLCHRTKRDSADIRKTPKAVNFKLIKGEILLGGPSLMR